MAAWGWLATALLAWRAVAAAQPEDGGPLTQLLADAKRGGQVVLVLIWAESCGERCAALYKIGQQAPQLRAVAYQAEGGEGRHVAERYTVTRFPALLLLDSEARELGRAYEPREAAALAGGAATDAALAAEVAAYPSDLDARFRLGARYAERGERAGAEEHLGVVATSTSGHAAAALWLLADALYLRGLGDAARAAQTARRLLERFPHSAAAPGARLTLAAAELRRGAVAVGEALLKSPDVPARRAVQVLLAAARWRSALELARRRLTRRGPDAILLARCLAHVGQRAQALQLLAQLHRQTPHDQGVLKLQRLVAAGLLDPAQRLQD